MLVLITPGGLLLCKHDLKRHAVKVIEVKGSDESGPTLRRGGNCEILINKAGRAINF